MPRKPTPTILEDAPTGEARNEAAEIELIPEPELVKEKITQIVDEATGQITEITQAEVVEVTPEGLKIEDINVVEAVENTAKGVAATVVETIEVQEIPVPSEEEVEKAGTASPLYKPMRSLLLAGLGLASYAVEESVFVIGKLVERGELTQKEGAHLVAEMSQKARQKLPHLPGLPMRRHKAAEAGEAVEETGEEAGEAVEETIEAVRAEDVEAVEAAEPAAEIGEEMEEEEEVEGLKNNVFITLNLFSGGSTIRLPRVKK